MYEINEDLINEEYTKINQVIFESRLIPVFGYIDEEKARKVICTLKALEKLDREETIQIIIHGSEGDIYAVLAIIDVMKELNCPVETICLGRAFGVALLLLSQGDYRYATHNSHMLLKYPSSLLRNVRLDQSSYELHVNKLKACMTDLYVNKTKNMPVNIDFDLSRGVYMDVYEALAYGLIDEVI